MTALGLRRASLLSLICLVPVLLSACGGGNGNSGSTAQVDAVKSTITAAPTTVTADGKATAAITVTLLDSNGKPFSGDADVSINATPCSDCVLHYTTASGQTTGTLGSSVAEDITLSFTVNGTASPNTAVVHFVPAVSATKSTITAAPTMVTADGRATATITVTLRDANGAPYTGAADLIISAEPCTACSLHESENATTATLSSTVGEDITLRFTVNGTASPNTAVVHFTSDWAWLAADGGTYWYVPSENLKAIQWDAAAPGSHISIDDQTVWHIEQYDNGYFFGPAVVKFAGYPRLCQYMIGSVTPKGSVYIAFNSVQAIPSGSPSITTGTGTMARKDNAWAFLMQMASGSSSTHVSHWAYMLQCTPDQACWNHLPGLHTSIPDLLARCGRQTSSNLAEPEKSYLRGLSQLHPTRANATTTISQNRRSR